MVRQPSRYQNLSRLTTPQVVGATALTTCTFFASPRVTLTDASKSIFYTELEPQNARQQR